MSLCCQLMQVLVQAVARGQRNIKNPRRVISNETYDTIPKRYSDALDRNRNGIWVAGDANEEAEDPSRLWLRKCILKLIDLS